MNDGVDRSGEEGRKLILVIDDDLDHRRIAAALLTYGGFAVLQAESTAAAERAVEAHRPDLILLDIRMPGKNGMEWFLEVRERLHYRGVPIAAYTSFSDVYQPQLDALGIPILSKMTKPSDFLDRVRELIAEPGTP